MDQKLFFEAQFPMGHQETFPRLSVFFLFMWKWVPPSWQEIHSASIHPMVSHGQQTLSKCSGRGDEADPVSALSILASEELALRDA